MSLRSRSGWLLSAPGWVLAAALVALSFEDPGQERALTAAFASVGVLLTWSVAFAITVRYPQRPL